MKTIQVQISGVSPLLQNRFAESAELPRASRKTLTPSVVPREVAELKTYRDKERRFYLPGTAISRLLRDAGANHKLTGSRRSVKYVVPAAVMPPGESLLLHHPGEPKRLLKTYEVDSRPIVNPNTKGRMMCHRPRFEEWGTSFALEIDDTLLPVSLIYDLLVDGGRQLGVGDYRPQNTGPFGRFAVVAWKE